MDLNEDDLLNFESPNYNLRKKVYDLQNSELENPLSEEARQFFLTQNFESVRDMVSKMILMSELDDSRALSLEDVFSESSQNISLPLFGTSVSCGFLGPADENIERHLSLDEHLIKHPAATFFVRASGDCMNPIIWDNDLLLIDRSLSATDGKIILAVLDGEFSVKRLLRSHQKITLMPENPVYQKIEITSHRDFLVWGVVTHIIHDANSI